MKSNSEAREKVLNTQNQPKVIGADPDFKRAGDDIVCPQCQTHFNFSSPSLLVTCPACNLSGFQYPDKVPTCTGCGTRGECIIIDGVHWKTWAPLPPDVMRKFQEQANQICEAWKKNLGITLNAERVGDHLTKLSEWINRKPKTIRYMNREELSNLRKEIFDALLAYGATKERAEELTASLPTVGDLLEPGTEQAAAVRITAASRAFDSETENPMPYLDRNGDLVVPCNSPQKYRWWQGGQSIAETMAELTNASDQLSCANG